jgi:hypothetical protein
MGECLVELDGRTGEGGGQVIRVAVALASLRGVGIHIHHVRGNRSGNKGTGNRSYAYLSKHCYSLFSFKRSMIVWLIPDRP